MSAVAIAIFLTGASGLLGELALSRRALAAGVLIAAAPAEDGRKLEDWRKFTALAPLGPSDATTGGAKRVGLPLAELSRILANDLVRGAHGRGGYFLSGDLTPEVFTDRCRFTDPTNDVASLAKYTKALSILFDPARSSVALLSGPVVDAGQRTISATIRAEGTLKLPWCVL